MATPTNLSEYYTSQGKTLAPDVAGRFADPAFKSAAEKAGYTPETYQVNMGNAEANQKILGYLNAPAENPVIVTGSKPAQQFAENTQYTNNAIQTSGYTPQTNPDGSQYNPVDFNYSDPYTQMLDKISTTSDKATQNLIATIKAEKMGRQNSINDQYDRLKQGLFSLGVSTGNINFTPDLVYGAVNNAENTRMTKLQELDRNEATALIEAQQASENKDFEVLKEKVDYIKSIKKSRTDLLKENYDALSYESKISELQAQSIYDAMQDLNETQKADYLKTISDKYGISMMSLSTALNNERIRRQGESLDLQQKQANLDKTKSGGTSGTGASGKLTKEQIALGDKKLNDSRGSDGHVDSALYIQAFQDWPGTLKEFLAAYPPDKYVNPDDPTVPDYLKPKKTTSGGRSS